MTPDPAARDEFGGRRWTEYTCATCGTVVLAPRFGLPPTGWDLTDYAGKEPARHWYLCSLVCVRAFTLARLTSVDNVVNSDLD